MSAMARPMKKKALHPSGSKLRRAADIALIVLGVAAIGLFVATKIIGDRAADPGALNVRNGDGAGTPGSSIGPENGSGQTGTFADLEAGPDEDEGSDDPILGPAILSDPAAARPFSPVDDPRLAALLDPEIERSLKVGRIPSLAVVLVSGDRVVWTRSAGLANIRVKTPAACDTVYLIASTFKTMSTTALLQQMELG